MIGVYILIGAGFLLVILTYLEIVGLLSLRLPFREMGQRISSSANLNLLLYEIVAISIVLGFPLLVQESQHPFLLEAFPTIWNQVLFGLILVFGLPILNVARYRRLGLESSKSNSVTTKK